MNGSSENKFQHIATGSAYSHSPKISFADNVKVNTFLKQAEILHQPGRFYSFHGLFDCLFSIGGSSYILFMI